MMRRLLFFLMMGACLSLSASNDEKKAVEVNSFVYLLDDETMTAEVTGLTSYTGVLDDQGVLEIPASVTFEGSNYSVTSIGSNAFRDKTGIKQVKMPESIITIGEAAFSECKFDAVNIPDGVQEIQRSAFSNNGWLQTVKIGKGIKTIAPNVFFMTALKTIVIEANSIPEADDTSFGDWTYDLQTRKPMLYVPGELVNSYRESNDFPWMYFEDSRIVAIRTDWKEPELPYSYGPDKVELDRLSYYLDKENKAAEVTKSKSLYYLNEMIEANGGKLEIPSVINVNGEDYIVRSIGDGAFMNLLDTRSLVLPETLVSIGDEAFYNLGVDSLSIPDNVISIGQKAFKSCDNLKAVNIGKGIKAIGDEAFNGCPVMNHIYLHADAIPDVGYYAFGDYDRYKTNIKTMVLFVPEGLVNDYQQSATTPWSDFTKSYIVVFGTDPSSLAPQVISVDNCSYLLDRTNLTAELINGKNWKADVLSIPASITVDGSAYQVTAIGGLDAKGMAPFSSCEGIKEIIIPNSVVSIGAHAFSYCGGVEALTIGESVKTIGVAAFNQCNSLRTVYVLAPWIPTTTVYYSDFSHEDWYRVTLYVPDDLVDAYKESQLNYWNSVRDENIKPLGTTSITSLQTESMNGTYYSIDGIRVAQPKKGVYIQKGKKVVIK